MDQKFLTVWQAIAYAFKKHLWGKVVVVKDGNFYVIKEKESK